MSYRQKSKFIYFVGIMFSYSYYGKLYLYVIYLICIDSDICICIDLSRDLEIDNCRADKRSEEKDSGYGRSMLIFFIYFLSTTLFNFTILYIVICIRALYIIIYYLCIYTTTVMQCIRYMSTSSCEERSGAAHRYE